MKRFSQWKRNLQCLQYNHKNKKVVASTRCAQWDLLCQADWVITIQVQPSVKRNIGVNLSIGELVIARWYFLLVHNLLFPTCPHKHKTIRDWGWLIPNLPNQWLDPSKRILKCLMMEHKHLDQLKDFWGRYGDRQPLDWPRMLSVYQACIIIISMIITIIIIIIIPTMLSDYRAFKQHHNHHCRNYFIRLRNNTMTHMYTLYSQ